MKNRKGVIMAVVAILIIAVAAFAYYSEGDLFQGRLNFFRDSQPKKVNVNVKRTNTQIEETRIDNPGNEPLDAVDVSNIDLGNDSVQKVDELNIDSRLREIEANDTSISTYEADDTYDENDVVESVDSSLINANESLDYSVLEDNSTVSLQNEIAGPTDVTSSINNETVVNVEYSYAPDYAESLDIVYTEPTVTDLRAEPSNYSLSQGGQLIFRYSLRGFDSANGTLYFNIDRLNGDFVTSLPEKNNVGNGTSSTSWGVNLETSASEKVEPGTYNLMITGQTADGVDIKSDKVTFTVSH